MQIHKNFDVREFVHPDVYKFINRSDGLERWRWFVSDFMLDCAVLLREVSSAPVILNTYHRGGKFVGRGFRPSNYQPKKGAIFSQHYMANAIDVSSPRLSVAALYGLVMQNQEKFEAIGLTTIEDPKKTVTWLHLDCRTKIKGLHPDKGFLIVQP